VNNDRAAEHRGSEKRQLAFAVAVRIAPAINLFAATTTNLRKPKRGVVIARNALAWSDGQVVRRQHRKAEDKLFASSDHRQVARRSPHGEAESIRLAEQRAGGLGSKLGVCNRRLDVSEELLGVNCQKVASTEKKKKRT
jgi:hypothetical protein